MLRGLVGSDMFIRDSSLFNSESFNEKSMYDPEKNAFPCAGTRLSPNSINLLELFETSFYV